MRVLFLTRYERLGSSSRMRAYQYLPFLQQMGIDSVVAPLLGNDYVKDLYAGRPVNVGRVIAAYLQRIGELIHCRNFDLLWIEKELFPWLPAWSEALLNSLGVPYAVDYDDAFFHRYDLHRNPLVRRVLGHNIDRVMRHASLVIAGNDYLAERALQAGARRVEILPTVVDLNRYPAVPRLNREVFTIGWIGSPATSSYLKTIQHSLEEVCRESKARLVLVGPGDDTMLPNIPLDIRRWSEDREVAEIQSFDAGIMPLPDRPWERGKCGYKLIQYMACGLPVVASPVGVNSQIVTDGINGFTAITDNDWVRALSILRDAPGLREQMGRTGRARVEEKYCLQVTAGRFAELLESVARQR